MLLLLGLVVLLAGAKTVLVDTLDPDLFWHLRVADTLAKGGIRPIVDDLSFVSLKQPWTPYSWLAELGMRAVWRGGGYRLAVGIAAMVIAGIFALVAAACMWMTACGANGGTQLSRAVPGPDSGPRTARLLQPNPLAAALATIFAIVLALPYLSFRPVTFGMALLAICVLLLLRDRARGERSASIWWIVPLAVLTVNVHLLAIVIPLWVAMLLAGSIWEWRQCRIGGAAPNAAEMSRRLRRYAILLNLTLLACLMTPMLGGAIRTAIHYQAHDPMIGSPAIAETLPFWNGWAGKISLALVIVLACGVAVNHRRLRLGEKLCLAVCALLLLQMGRMAPVFVLIAAPIFAATLPRFSTALLRRSIVIALLAGGCAACAMRICLTFPAAAMPLDKWLNRNGPDCPGGYPTESAAFVEQNIPRITGNLVNEYSWGGYLAWRLGDRFKIMLDGRTQLYSAEVWRQTTLGSAKDCRQFLQSIPADAAIIPRRDKLFHDALLDCGWKIVHTDDWAIVLVPPGR